MLNYVKIRFPNRKDTTMPRTPGARNKSWREVEAAGKFLIEKAKLMRKNEALNKALNDALTKKGTSK